MMLSANMLIGIFLGPICVGFYARQRFELSSLVEIIGQLLQVLLIVIAFIYLEPNIVYLSLAILVTTVGSASIKLYLSMKLIETVLIYYSCHLAQNNRIQLIRCKSLQKCSARYSNGHILSNCPRINYHRFSKR